MFDEPPLLRPHCALSDDKLQHRYAQVMQFEEERRKRQEDLLQREALGMLMAPCPDQQYNLHQPSESKPRSSSPEELEEYCQQFVQEWPTGSSGKYVHFPYVPPHERTLTATASQAEVAEETSAPLQSAVETVATPQEITATLQRTSTHHKATPLSPTHMLSRQTLLSGEEKSSLANSSPIKASAIRPTPANSSPHKSTALRAAPLNAPPPNFLQPPIDYRRMAATLALLERGTRHPSLDHMGLNRLLVHLVPVLDTTRALPHLFAHLLYVNGLEAKALATPPQRLAQFYTVVRAETMREYFRYMNRRARDILCPPPFGQSHLPTVSGLCTAPVHGPGGPSQPGPYQ
ncbi:hypothetical protein CspeluHIS016_0108130 [Cutaneotrichosporon spelunceum]|uniref:Uncharacterized protein n=1 Tax=Cutaneotrichosporon spelunceum TaxID=1672016 RepID=A0AAD3TP85_9TREE|nr:hypothetical protein CspeluHIS016_0108130 [Cutaneotrichosporon spelunceum]